MEKEQKERLDQELRFLKESLEAEVISKAEYEKGKERIERKLKELDESTKASEQSSADSENSFSNAPEETAEKTEKQDNSQEEIEIKEIKEEPTKIIGAEDSEQSSSKNSGISKELDEGDPEENFKEKEEPDNDSIEETKEANEHTTIDSTEDSWNSGDSTEEEQKGSKKWLRGLTILIIIAIIFFSIKGCNNQEDLVNSEDLESQPVCSSDSDCNEPGKVGICSNPGEVESECEFKEDSPTKLTIINNKNCKLCDTTRIENLIVSLFPKSEIEKLDYSDSQARELVGKLKIQALPSYVLDSSVTDTLNFNNFKGALIKIEDKYVMTNTASGANYYFKRPEIKNRLDVYTLSGTTNEVASHIQRVSDLFGDKITIITHEVSDIEKDQLEKDLAINTYPAFLLNNQIKFGGVIPANMIKEKICLVNYFDECEKELEKNIK